MIGDKTAKLYEKMLTYLNNDKGFGIKEFQYIPKSVVAHITQKSDSNSTQKVYLSAVINLLKENSLTVPDVYAKMMIKLKNRANISSKSQELTESQQENMMSYEDILKVYEEYAKTVDKTSITDYKDFMILSLYVLNEPVRSDYNDMIIYYKTPPKDTEGNYLIFAPRKKEFVFQEYKTADTYGKVSIKVNKPLIPVLNHWFSLIPDKKYLLGDLYADAWLSQRIRLIMKRLTGKEVGINILRHARITSLLGGQKSILEKEVVANSMLHSLSLQEKYLVKNQK